MHFPDPDTIINKKLKLKIQKKSIFQLLFAIQWNPAKPQNIQRK
jgi:hypothetical protein